MEDNEFFNLVEGIFNNIEDQIDEMEFDIDIDVSGGLLSILFPEGSSCVLSKQVANHEIWVAAKSGGFHLKRAGEGWRCDNTDETLEQLLNRVFMEQVGKSLF